MSKILIFPILLLGIISVLIPNAVANDDECEINQEKVLELNVLCNAPLLGVQKDAQCGGSSEVEDPEVELIDPRLCEPTPAPARLPQPTPALSDEDCEINQEKVMELNVLCNAPILGVQKDAQCGSMGMKADEQGNCEDYDLNEDVILQRPTQYSNSDPEGDGSNDNDNDNNKNSNDKIIIDEPTEPKEHEEPREHEPAQEPEQEDEVAQED